MKTQNDYLQFLEQKQKTHILSGFEIDETNLNRFMFPFQKFIVKRIILRLSKGKCENGGRCKSTNRIILK